MYFLFLRSTALFLGSFFARTDPEGMAYCIGEEIGPAAEVGTGAEEAATVLAISGIGAGGGAVDWGTATGSGRGLGKICLSRLFL